MRSLQSTGIGLAVYLTNLWSPILNTIGAPLNSVSLSSVNDERTDRRRIRDTNTQGNKELLPAVVISRDTKIEFVYHTRINEYLFKTYSTINKNLYNYMPVLLKYSVRIYFTSFEIAEEFISRLHLYYIPQFTYPIITGDITLDSYNLHCTSSMNLKELTIINAKKTEREEEGNISIIEIPFSVYSIIFDEPVNTKIIYSAIASIYSFDGVVINKDTPLDTIYNPIK